MLKKLPARSVTVFLDACFTGVGGDGRKIVQASPAGATRRPEKVGPNTVVFTAAEADQIATWDDTAGHGMFTHHVLDALYGDGDRDGDGAVTTREVERHLQEHLWHAVFKKTGDGQNAVLIDGTGTGARVLAAAPVDGAFPARPDLDAPDPDPVVGGPGDDDSTDGDDPSSPALDLAAVTGGDAFLVVETAPAGAAVLVGGARVGETPLERFDMRAGSYTVTLDHPTHETAVLENQTLEDHLVLRIEQALKPATGKVTVITRPSGGWVEHGGARLADSTPVTLDGLPSGPQVLTLGAANHHAVRVEVEVPKGGVVLVRRQLEEVRYGTLTLELEPEDARVALADGDASYRAGMKLAEGEHRVRVTREGYHEVSRIVTVSGATRLRIALERAPQPFTVVTTPADAAVRFLDGSEAYRPGMVLLPGSYRVRVSAEGWEAQEATVGHGTAPTRHAVRLARLQPGDEFKDCEECPKMVVVRAGSFTMGSISWETGRLKWEGPQYPVTIPQPFAVGKYEVTFAEWDACVAAGGCKGYRPDDRGWGRGDRPVINVSWDDAKTYVRWLSQKMRQTYRLLSEAEWEYAARAGTTGPFHFGSTISTDQANYDGNSTYGSGRRGVYRGKTVHAGSFPANGFGLHDMHGNVWEWVEDCWHNNYAGAPGDGRAWDWGGDCKKRVVRGGSWNNDPELLRSAYRFRLASGIRSYNTGFRVAQTLTP